MSVSPVRVQHYNPKACLRRFVDDSGTVLRTYRGPDDQLHEKRFAPSATGFEPDLYSLDPNVPDFSVPRTDAIETAVLMPIDTGGDRALRTILKYRPSALTDKERHALAVFMNSLLERHPQRIQGLQQRLEERALERQRKFLDSAPTAEHRADREEAIAEANFPGRIRNQLRQGMAEAIHEPAVIDYFKSFFAFKITLEESTKFHFVTSDNPVLVNSGTPWPIQWMSLAISPHDLLFMNREQGIPDQQTLIAIMLTHNLDLFRQSRYVFSRDPLADFEGVRMRNAARLNLLQVPWPKGSGKRNASVHI